MPTLYDWISLTLGLVGTVLGVMAQRRESRKERRESKEREIDKRSAAWRVVHELEKLMDTALLILADVETGSAARSQLQALRQTCQEVGKALSVDKEVDAQLELQALKELLSDEKLDAIAESPLRHAEWLRSVYGYLRMLATVRFFYAQRIRDRPVPSGDFAYDKYAVRIVSLHEAAVDRAHAVRSRSLPDMP